MRADFLALSFLHNSREDGGKKGSTHFDKTPQYDVRAKGSRACSRFTTIESNATWTVKYLHFITFILNTYLLQVKPANLKKFNYKVYLGK